MKEPAHRLPVARAQQVSSWGRFPVERCDVYRPERISEVADLVAEAPQSSVLPRGLGRSYGDAALNRDGGLIRMDRLDRYLDFDPETGALHCEAAVSFADVLETFLPRGFFFPVTPGTKFITIGGAIAADVHGKNHHRSGSIAKFLLEFTLLTASGDRLACSRKENADVFWATLGGMGLTGIILDARIELQPVETARMQVDTERLPDLDSVLECMADSDADYDYSVAWIDCVSGGRALGRSVLTRANHAKRAELDAVDAERPFAFSEPWAPSVPFVLPNGCLNRYSMRAFNVSYLLLEYPELVTPFQIRMASDPDIACMIFVAIIQWWGEKTSLIYGILWEFIIEV